jgi:hypothetical protein
MDRRGARLSENRHAGWPEVSAAHPERCRVPGLCEFTRDKGCRVLIASYSRASESLFQRGPVGERR